MSELDKDIDSNSPAEGDLEKLGEKSSKEKDVETTHPLETQTLESTDTFSLSIKSDKCAHKKKSKKKYKIRKCMKFLPPSSYYDLFAQINNPDQKTLSEEEMKAKETSPCGRFLKFNQLVGSGSFKTVYKGLDTITGVAVAWCELKERLNKAERHRFRKEADMLSHLHHPNIVRFFDYWKMNSGHRLILITELMTSGTLREYLFKIKKINMKILKSWCRQILKGLKCLHSQVPPIIHRDIKCDNIFISGTTGSVKIGDLGLATLKSKSFAKSIIGTPGFMAPEMFDEQYDESVDIFAFGMCMLELSISEYPYAECTSPGQVYMKIVKGVPPENLEKVKNKKVKEIINLCIQKRKEERPSAKELLQLDFFKEEIGIKLSLLNKEEAISSTDSVVQLQLRVLDSRKRTDKYKENEAIQFCFSLVNDDPDEVARALAEAGMIVEEDIRGTSLIIGEQISMLMKERKNHQRKHRLDKSQDQSKNEDLNEWFVEKQQQFDHPKQAFDDQNLEHSAEDQLEAIHQHQDFIQKVKSFDKEQQQPDEQQQDHDRNLEQYDEQQQQLDELQQDHDQNLQQDDEQQQQLDELQQDHDRNLQLYGEQQQELDELQQDHDRNLQQDDEQQQQLDELQQDHDRNLQLYDEQQQELDELQQDHDRNLQQDDEQQQQLDELQQDHNRNLQLYDEQQQQLDELQQDHDRNLQQDDEQQQQLDELQQDHDRNLQQDDEQQQQLDEFQEDHDRNLQLYDKKRNHPNEEQQVLSHGSHLQQNDEKQQQLDELQQDHDQNLQQYDEKQQQHDKQQQDHGRNSQQYDEKQQQHDKQQQDHDLNLQQYDEKQQQPNEQQQNHDKNLQQYEDKPQQPDEQQQYHDKNLQQYEDKPQQPGKEQQDQNINSQQYDDKPQQPSKQKQDQGQNLQQYDEKRKQPNEKQQDQVLNLEQYDEKRKKPEQQ